MAYTDIDNPGEYFNTKLYTGNGSAGHAITGVGFQPDWIWIKDRGATNWHSVRDSVRGTSKQLFTNETNAEETAAYVTAFGSNGFTLGTNNTDVNASNHTYASWNWKAGTSFTNDASGTSIGSIDSAGSFNNDAGFSICSYTGNGTAGATIKHGLNSVPSMMIIKDREGGEDSIVFHQSLGNTKFCYLSTNAAAGTDDGAWNDTSPTTSVFTIGDYGNVNNNNHDYICYAFSEKQGYSKFGSYIGNGNADGTFVYTGFKPAMVICKKSNASGTNWGIIDNKRAKSFNQISAMLNPNSTGSEGANNNCDFVSNGFKWRTNDGNSNASGDSYIYMAFAEQPFVTSTGVPATAR